MIDAIDQACLTRLRDAVVLARHQAWSVGAWPERCLARAHNRGERTVIDVDASLTSAYTPKEAAAGTFKGGYGHHPLLAFLDGTGEAVSAIIRPGNAGSNTAADHKQVLDLALAQLDASALDGDVLIRADGAGATHELCLYCRERSMRFSFGFDLTETVRQVIVNVPESCWVRALRPGAKRECEHSWMLEITDTVDLSTWPEGSRLIARRTRLRDGDQQSFADHDGYRLLHQSGRLSRHARKTILRLSATWPWARLLTNAFTRLRALPAPAG